MNNSTIDGTIQGIFIICMLLLFFGAVFWAWSSKRKITFDAAARLPLEEDGQKEEKP